MKEIKFRQPIWDRGEIVAWHIWGFKDGLYQLPINQHESYIFSGKCDKNGVEIYEGQYVRYVDNPTDMETGTYRVIVLDGTVCLDKCFTPCLREIGLEWLEVVEYCL